MSVTGLHEVIHAGQASNGCMSAVRPQVREVGQLRDNVSTKKTLKLMRNSTGFQSSDSGFDSHQRLQDDCICPIGTEHLCNAKLCPRKVQ